MFVGIRRNADKQIKKEKRSGKAILDISRIRFNVLPLRARRTENPGKVHACKSSSPSWISI